MVVSARTADPILADKLGETSTNRQASSKCWLNASSLR